MKGASLVYRRPVQLVFNHEICALWDATHSNNLMANIGRQVLRVVDTAASAYLANTMANTNQGVKIRIDRAPVPAETIPVDTLIGTQKPLIEQCDAYV